MIAEPARALSRFHHRVKSKIRSRTDGATSVINFCRHAWTDEDGQALAEYASLNGIILLGGLALVTGWPFFEGFIKAYEHYLGSIFFMLNLAMP